MNAVWGSKHLKELTLDNNRIADRGAQLTTVLLGSAQLKTLDLGFNRIGSVGIEALMKSLSGNAFLKYFSIFANILDNISSKALSYALAYNTSLQKLYLYKCQISYIEIFIKDVGFFSYRFRYRHYQIVKHYTMLG